VLVEFSILPVGSGSSLSKRLSEILEIVDSSGLPYKVNPMGTVVEGEWDDLFRLIRKCHKKALKKEQRVVTRIVVDDRKGKTDRLEEKVKSIEKKLGRKLKK
jgi:uncharacterized protein (TIGR00106 family)